MVINQVNQFSQRLPIAMIRPEWSRGKTGKGRWKQARTKPLIKEKIRKAETVSGNECQKKEVAVFNTGRIPLF